MALLAITGGGPGGPGFKLPPAGCDATQLRAVGTMAVMVQCLAISLLCLQTVANGSAAGLSARVLGLEAALLALRLSSATWLNGYLPVVASGDMVYQLVDVCSRAMVL